MQFLCCCWQQSGVKPSCQCRTSECALKWRTGRRVGKNLGGREVKKKRRRRRRNFHIVNKGPCLSYHEIYRPALLLLVDSAYHNGLLMLGRNYTFMDARTENKKGANEETKDRNSGIIFITYHILVRCYHVSGCRNLCSVSLAQLKLTDVGTFPARGWRQFSLETIMFGQAPLASMYENEHLYLHIHTHSLDRLTDTCCTECVRTTSHSPPSQAGVTGWVSVRLGFSVQGETCRQTLYLLSDQRYTH